MNKDILFHTKVVQVTESLQISPLGDTLPLRLAQPQGGCVSQCFLGTAESKDLAELPKD